MKKIVFAVAIIAFSCTFVSCEADSVDDASLMNNETFATGDSGGGGGTIPTTPPPPPPPGNGGGGK